MKSASTPRNAGDDADRKRIETVERAVQERSCRERRRREQERCSKQDLAEQLRLRPRVGRSAAEPVPEREKREHQPDHIRPDHVRASEVGRDKPDAAISVASDATPARKTVRPRRGSESGFCQSPLGAGLGFSVFFSAGFESLFDDESLDESPDEEPDSPSLRSFFPLP